jgi:hypothetical protein
VVFFLTAARPAMGARRWDRRRHAVLDWLVRRLSGWEVAHVAIGDGGAVLNPTYRGNRLWPFDAFALSHPGVAWGFLVPISRPIDWTPHEEDPPRPKPWMPTLARWATRGRWPRTRDCVAEVSACLRSAGVAVPRRVVTPAHLFDWLRAEGFELEDFGGDSTGDSGSGDRGAGEAAPAGCG